MVGLAFLLTSCANSNQKPVNVGSAFPYDYNADARGFEGTWPYGRGGYH
jgi:hypothetical protein